MALRRNSLPARSMVQCSLQSASICATAGYSITALFFSPSAQYSILAAEKELEKCKDFYQASEKFKAGVNYKCLTSLNCIGGKALLYIDKILLNPKREKSPIENDELID